MRSTLYGHGWRDAPARMLRTAFVEHWLRDEARGNLQRDDEPVIGDSTICGQPLTLRRFMGFPPDAAASGHIDEMCLAARQGVGLVHGIEPAADIVKSMCAMAKEIMAKRLPALAGAR